MLKALTFIVKAFNIFLTLFYETWLSFNKAMFSNAEK